MLYEKIEAKKNCFWDLLTSLYFDLNNGTVYHNFKAYYDNQIIFQGFLILCIKIKYLCRLIFPFSFQTFNATDTMLKNVDVWPTIKAVSFFESKLTFQIQHSIFRTKIREGEKTIFEVLKWYNEITTFILDYISVSIKDSDVSDFYRNVIAFKVIY